MTTIKKDILSVSDNEETYIEEFYGEILEVTKEHVIINCLIDQETNYNQVRKFDLLPLKEIIDKYKFIKIRIITKTGSRLFEFHGISDDLNYLFNNDDPFKDINR